jgi:hypothetical protein
MKNEMKNVYVVGGGLSVVAALLLSVGLFGCEGSSVRESIDNIETKHFVCDDYCDKKFGCMNQTPTSEASNTCVKDCSNTIENNCGNEHQAAANDKMGECVDKSCANFLTCLVFESAPECFGFVTH